MPPSAVCFILVTSVLLTPPSDLGRWRLSIKERAVAAGASVRDSIKERASVIFCSF